MNKNNIMSKFQKMFLSVEDYDDAVERAKIEQYMLEIPKRAIIDGLLYDTSKSKMIMKHKDLIFPISDSYLYMTPKGRFFDVNGSDIRAISQSDAKKILSTNIDKYQEIFGKVEDA